jgi:hypothetical protein
VAGQPTFSTAAPYGGNVAPTPSTNAASGTAGTHASFLIWVVLIGVVLPALILGGLQMGGFKFIFKGR